jgi:NAD+ diphosphatase
MLHTPATFTASSAPLAANDAPGTLHFLFHQGRLLLRDDGLALPTSSLGLATGPWQAMGTLDGRHCQAAVVEAEPPALEGYSWRGLRSLFGEMDDGVLGVAGRALQVVEWARTHRFCGACGGPTRQSARERCMHCDACGHLAYPRISPAMMVLIRRQHAGEGQVLLAFHTQSPSKRFSPLAGFLEAGESIEEAVHREVFEEVGLRVHNLKYFMSQSWPFPHSLMIAVTADYLDGEIRVDANEIAEARWFGPHDDWPEKGPTVSISSLLVDAHRPG